MANVNYTQTQYNFSGAYLTGIAGVNTGIVVPWGSVSVPSGFLECNGQSVSTATYASLFAVIGYTYGGAGASFNVPDLTDRIVVSKSNTKSLAQTGGANTVAPTGNISGATGSTALTTQQIPSHSHSVSVFGMCQPPGIGSNTAMGEGPNSSSNTGGGQSHDHTLSANFIGTANSVLQPYLVLIYIIKT